MHSAPRTGVAAAVLEGVGWFIPGHIREHLDLLRARLYVGLSFLVAANAALFCGLHVLHDLPGAGREVVYVLAGMFVLASSLPFLLRWGIDLRVLRRCLVGGLLVGVFAVAYFDGGLASGAVFWLVVTPLFAAFLGGAPLGWGAALASLALSSVLYVGTVMGHEFPTGLSDDDARLHYTINFLSAILFVTVQAALYEGPMVRHFRELSIRLARTNRELQTELVERQRAQHQAEAANRAKDVLLANMSHEFRTPLTGILGGTEALLIDADADDRPLLHTIDRGAQRLLRTLDGVLDLAWIESGGMEVRPSRVRLAAEVEQIVQPFAANAQQKGLAFEVRAEDVEVTVDRDVLRRVLAALLDNAVRFTPEGGVSVTTCRDAGGVVVEVADDGVGMSAEFAPRAVEPFRQASEGDTRTHEGCGIGLAVADRLVRLAAGTLSVESEPGAGTTVRVRLPRAHAPPAGPGAGG